jgi:hypothetical protein
LTQVRTVISQVTWALMDAAMWGGKQLDAEGTDPQAVAEGLLDRVGAVLATVTVGSPSPGPAGPAGSAGPGGAR